MLGGVGRRGIGDRTGGTITVGETMRLGNRVYTFGAWSEVTRQAIDIDVSIEVTRVLGVTDVDVLEVIRVPEYEYCDHHFDEAIEEFTSDGRG